MCDLYVHVHTCVECVCVRAYTCVYACVWGVCMHACMYVDVYIPYNYGSNFSGVIMVRL